MLILQRLNMDSSWKLTAEGFSLLIDPWLVGAEIDGFAWFNKQWHVSPPIAPNQVQDYQAILISQPFSDHCHEETLALLQPVPIYNATNARKRLLKSIASKRLHNIVQNLNEWTTIGPYRLNVLPAPRQLKASFNGLLIAIQDCIVVYLPHGYKLSARQIACITNFPKRILISSFSSFRLPFFLGGTVNPGLKNSKTLAEQIQANYIFQTHDEDKEATGLVKKIATTSYPEQQLLNKTLEGRFVYLDMKQSSYIIE